VNVVCSPHMIHVGYVQAYATVLVLFGSGSVVVTLNNASDCRANGLLSDYIGWTNGLWLGPM